MAATVTVMAGCKDRPPRPPKIELQVGEMELGLNPRWDREAEVEPTAQRLYGRWVVRRYEHGDCAFIDYWPWPELKNRPPEFEIDADGLRVTIDQDGGQPAVPKVPVRLHKDHSPKQFELVGREKTVPGIFKVLTDGRLVVAMASDFGDADKPPTVPTDFDSRRNDIFVLVCQRVPPPTAILPPP